VAIVGMEKGPLIQHLEVAIVCEESSTNANNNRVILDVYPIMKGEKKKVEKPMANVSKSREECQYCKKFNHPEKKFFWNPNNLENKLKEKHEVSINEVATQ
jgi:hypothetical protein